MGRREKKIDVDELLLMEKRGMSEAEIAEYFKITRMTLYRIRKRMGCRDKSRSDKGKLRKKFWLDNKIAELKKIDKAGFEKEMDKLKEGEKKVFIKVIRKG